MRYLLQILKRATFPVKIGRYGFITYGDGTMAIRQDTSGLMSPEFKITRLGLMRAFDWIEDMERLAGNDLVYR